MSVLAKHIVLVAALALTACGPRSDQELSGSDLDFILFEQGSIALSAKVKQPKITIGLAGPYNGIRSELEKNLQSIVLKWIEPMRSMTSDPLASSVEVIESESNVDAIVEIVPGVHAHTYIQDTPRVRIDSSGYFGSYNVILHEFGHAFALLDTYQGGQSGNCQAGQPQAVMCNTSFADLQADDAKGIQAIFKSGFPNDKPGLPQQDAVAINVALNESETELLFAAVSSGKLLSGTMEYCVGESCSAADSTWSTAGTSDGGGSAIYATKILKIEAGLMVNVRFKGESKQASRRIKLSAI